MIKSIKNPITLIALFLVPGLIVAVAYAFCVNPVVAWGLPKTVAIGIAALAVLVPLELGIIVYQNHKQNRIFSIRNMIPYNNSMSIKLYLLLVPLLLFWAVAVLTFGKSIDVFIKKTVFSWLPDWYILSADYTQYSKPQLIITLIVSFFVLGVIAPIVEEIYFRGFLLPRMEWLGIAAPVINACLFSLYHFWSPWQVITRIIALIPFCYVSYKMKNIRVVIIVHCLLNIMGDSVGLLMFIF